MGRYAQVETDPLVKQAEFKQEPTVSRKLLKNLRHARKTFRIIASSDKKRSSFTPRILNVSHQRVVVVFCHRAIKQARGYIFNTEPNFSPAPKHTCPTDSCAYTGGEKTRKIVQTFQTGNTIKCLIFPVFVLTCRYLAGDVTYCRKEKQESQEYGEKCIHVLKRGRV